MKLIKQCDFKGNLGESKETLCSAGCVTTCLSSLSAWYGSYISPDKLVKLLKYTPSGLLYWNSMNDVTPMRFVFRYYRRDDKKLKEILYSKNDAAILQVNNGKHWVALVGYSKIFGYKIFDPLKGDIIFLTKKYGNVIQGFTQVTRK